MHTKTNTATIAFCTLLGSGTLLGADHNNTAEQLGKITVVDSTSAFLNGDYATTRSNVALDDMPESVQVFNEHFIRDSQPESIEDIVTMASNVISLGDNNGRENVFALRGFMNLPVLRDGLNIDNAVSNPELYNLERVEVLKGPESLQYGEGGAGGLINLLKKRPDQKAFFAEAGIEATTRTRKTVKLDTGGAFDDKGAARYRLVTTYTYQDEYKKHFDTPVERLFVAPSVAFDLSDNHTLTLMAEYLNVKEPSDYGTAITSDGKAAVPYDSINSHPDDKMSSTQTIVGFDLDSVFARWNSSFRYRYVDYTMDMGDTYLPSSYNESDDTFSRMYSYMKYENKEHIFQYTANTAFEVATTEHRITLGTDYQLLEQKSKGLYDRTILYTIDYSEQVFEPFMTTLADHPAAVDFLGDGFDIERFGGFVQDNIVLTDALIANLGFRFDKINIKADGDTEADSKDATTPNVGLLYRFPTGTALYANYSESFNMQDVRYKDSNGDLLDPEKGKGYEIGVRQKLLDDTLFISAALFRIEKKNTPTYDTATMTYNASDKQESQGFEIDINGKLTPEWSLLASYGYTDAKADYYARTYYYDKKMVGVPKHSANLFSTYALTPALFVSGTVRYIGARYVDYANTVEVDAVTVFDASIGYEARTWSVNLGVKNIADTEYFESVGANGLGSTIRNNYLGLPRTFIATAYYRF